MQNYTVYHLHTELSLLDSCTNFKLYVDRAKELGQTAICFTEHGNCYNWIEKKEYCEEQGIKYLHGVEAYLTKELYEYPEVPDEWYEAHLGCDEKETQEELSKFLEENKKKVRDNYHTVLIAKNYDGVKEINALLDNSTQEDHFYYKNRITFDEFKNISDNVIKISACLASPLNKLRDESLIQYYDYLEVQPHINSEEQKEYNQWLYQMSIKYNKPLIAGTDTHSLNKYKAECRSILQKAKHIIFTNEDEFDLTYKSYDELVQMFKAQNSLPEKVYLEAIENTNRMANSVETFVLDKSFKYAKCYDDDEAVLKQRVNEGYRDKLRRGVIKKNPQYAVNVKEEFRVFKKIGMLGFMLFMSDLVRWCWANGIPIGYCRGSVGGSTIAYLTDIIDVDPIVWHTVFSRFANEDRKELGDIDIDISPTQRHLVYEHIIDSFGLDYTAYILAIGTVSDKGTIDEIGRALSDKWTQNNIEYQAEYKRICDIIEELSKNSDANSMYGLWETEEFGYKRLREIEQSAANPYSLDNIARIKKEYEEDPDGTKKKYPDIFYYFEGLLNTAISQSMHPAGIIVSPITLPDNYGTFWADGKRILQINMEECHEVSLNKYDLLGLKNVEIIKDTCALAGIPYPKSNEINWNDEKVWADIITSPAGIFQFEGDYAFKMLQSFQPHKINDMSLVNAALRPSGASYRDRLLAHEINHNPSEIIDDLLKDNFGFLVFQEDTIAFLQKICGLSGSEADNIRRAIGRKQKDRLEKAMPSILEGYCSKSDKPRDVAEKEAKAFLQIIEDSSNYQFGFNHSTGYSMIGYTCAYMRYYYPKQFIAAYLNNANNEDDIVNGTKLAQSKGIEILTAKFRHSKDIYLPDENDNKIYKGVASIKFLNNDVANELYNMRNEHFDSFVDIIKAFPGNSRQLDILIKLGFFSPEFGSIGTLLRIVDLYNLYAGKRLLKKEKCVLPPEILSKYCTETAKQYKITDSEGLLQELCGMIPKDCRVPLMSEINWQQEYLGYCSVVMPEQKNVGYVMNVDCKYSPKITLYRLDNGTTVMYKLSKALYQKQPFDVGSCIAFRSELRNKSRKTENGWEKIDGAYDEWITAYVLKNNL